jgi:hypothetical protein
MADALPELYRDPVLDEAGIRHGFTCRQGGVSEGRHASLNLGSSWGDEPARVEENLRRVAAAAGFLPARLCQVRQVHGTDVIAVDAPERRRTEADGMATAEDLVLGVLSADCVSLLLGDGRGRVVAAHAGWRGTVAGMAGAAVAAAVRLGARVEELRAAMGPSIGPCCFVVGEDVAAQFAAVVPDSVVRGAEGVRVDLWRANRVLLRAAGVPDAQIGADPPCTRCDPRRFFSYRRDGAGIGQHLAFIIGGKA